MDALPKGKGLPEEQLKPIRRAWRDQYGSNVSRLARAAGRDRSMVSQVLNGHRAPGMKVATSLAKALGVSLDLFRVGDDWPDDGDED